MMKNNRSLKKPNAGRIMLCLYVQAIAGDSDNTDQATHKTGSTSPSSDCCNCQTSTATPAKPGGLSLTLESVDIQEMHTRALTRQMNETNRLASLS